MRPALLCLLLLAACNPRVDFGDPCRLTRPAFEDGGGVAFVDASDSSLDSRFDMVASGDPECEDLLCVRQAGKDYRALDASGSAHGECSTPCSGDDDCGDAARGLVCSQLAFDPAFLERLRETDPATYRKNFGDSAAARVCVDPGLPLLTP